MNTRRGFFGVLAGIPLAVKKAIDGAGRRRTSVDVEYPTEVGVEDEFRFIDRGLGPVRQEIADELDEAEIEVDNNTIDMTDLGKIDAVRFYNRKRGDAVLIAASFVPSQLYRAGSAEPMGSVKTDLFSLPGQDRHFELVWYELLDKDGNTLQGPSRLANPAFVKSGDSADIALESI